MGLGHLAMAGLVIIEVDTTVWCFEKIPSKENRDMAPEDVCFRARVL